MNKVLNVWYSPCTYKRAKCKGCYEKLIEGCKILSVSRTQGSFSSVSNYCMKCAERELTETLDELTPIIQNIISIQETLETDLAKMKQVEDCFNEAKQKFGTTLQKLSDN